MEAAIERIIGNCFGGRVLPFEANAAPVYGEIRAARRIMGRSIKELDCMIAAIARVNEAAVATRDVSAFEDCGIKIINPWMA